MGRQYWVTPQGPFHIADGAAYANSAALTDVAPTPQILLGAGQLEIGSRFEFSAVFRYSNTGTPTLTLGLYTGTIGQAIGSAAVLAVSSALTTVTTVTNRTCWIKGHGHVRAHGASGSVFATAKVSNVTTGLLDMAPATAPAAVTVDTTVARYVTLGATWGTANAANTLTCHEFGFRLLN